MQEWSCRGYIIECSEDFVSIQGRVRIDREEFIRIPQVLNFVSINGGILRIDRHYSSLYRSGKPRFHIDHIRIDACRIDQDELISYRSETKGFEMIARLILASIVIERCDLLPSPPTRTKTPPLGYPWNRCEIQTETLLPTSIRTQAPRSARNTFLSTFILSTLSSPINGDAAMAIFDQALTQI